MEHSVDQKRHTLAHLLAAAVLKYFPHAKTTIGPAVENGFYYDFDFGGGEKPTEEDLKKIQKEMRSMLKSWHAMEGTKVTLEEAKEAFKGNEYKIELIDEINERGEDTTLYTAGTFTDLCRGGHSESPAKDIAPDSFKLDRIAGAYWRGDEHNTMLTRIYGLAFDTKEELEEYEHMREEMKERDHRKIGKEQGLWTFSELVGAGLPLFTPKGTALRGALYEALLEISKRYGMQPVTIPHMAKRRLYEISGHAEKFGDELLTVQSKYDEFVLKPVNCPHHTQIYASEPRSYRDLPIRFMESTMQYRDEQPGEIGGLTRVRAITVDDGHVFCRINQVADEAKNIVNIIKEFYSALGMWGNHWVSLSVRDPHTPEKYIGTDEDWEKAEVLLKQVSDDMKLDARRMEGEAALYGPKLDFMFTDALGRERQLATVQIDFAMPARFELEYTDSDGSKKTPVMIHRAILGSYERFLALLIEHFNGAYPLWLSPIQVKVLPVSEKHVEYAKEVAQKLKDEKIRVELDASDESLGKRIRQAKLEKVPYFFVIGDKEVESNTVTVEGRGGSEGAQKLEKILETLLKKIKERALD